MAARKIRNPEFNVNYPVIRDSRARVLADELDSFADEDVPFLNPPVAAAIVACSFQGVLSQ